MVVGRSATNLLVWHFVFLAVVGQRGGIDYYHGALGCHLPVNYPLLTYEAAYVYLPGAC